MSMRIRLRSVRVRVSVGVGVGGHVGGRFYAGLGASLAGHVPSSALFFAVYETSKVSLTLSHTHISYIHIEMSVCL